MNRKHLLLSVTILGLLTACASHQQNLDNIDTTNINQLESVRVTTHAPSGSPIKTEISSLRLKALRDSAISIGAQAGLAWASEAINVRLGKDSKYLDSIYNFNAMMLSHGVLPPVLEEGDYTLNLDDPNTIRVSDRTYKIVQQARFATTPPNWREYLWLTYTKPELPDKSLLPRNHVRTKNLEKRHTIPAGK